MRTAFKDPAHNVDDQAWTIIESLLSDREGAADPYASYARLHELGEDFLTPNGTHIVIGHGAVAEMMRNPLFLKNNAFGASQKTAAFSPLTPDQQKQLDDWDADAAPLLGTVDPPDHGRIRGLVQRTFLPKHVSQLRKKILSEIDRLLGAIDPAAPADMSARFGAPFAPEIMAELIGLPADRRAYVSGLTAVYMRGIDPASPVELRLASAEADFRLREYVREVIALRRAEPRDDLLTALVRESGGVLSEAELVRLINILYVGGYETTAHMIGNGLVALLNSPDQFELLKSDLDNLLRPAVEEMLRIDSAISLTQVYPAEGAMLRGRPADANASYIGLLTAANHDPRVYPEPDRFLIQRERKPIQTFGGGPHFCLGMNLARLELEMVFRELVQRFPKMRLLESRPPRIGTFQQQSYQRVPVILSPASLSEKRILSA